MTDKKATETQPELTRAAGLAKAPFDPFTHKPPKLNEFGFNVE
jgi:hypothetical protein